MDVADLEVLFIVINRLAVNKDQKSHYLNLMNTGEYQTSDLLDLILWRSNQASQFDILGTATSYSSFLLNITDTPISWRGIHNELSTAFHTATYFVLSFSNSSCQKLNHTEANNSQFHHDLFRD